VIAAIRDNDVRSTIAVQVCHRNVSRRPRRPPEGPCQSEIPAAVVDENDLGVWGVVTQDDIGCAITIDVHEIPRIRTISRIGEVVPRGELAVAVSEHDSAHSWPMTSLDQHDVELTIAIHIADADVGRRVRRRLELERPRIGWEGTMLEG